MMSDIGYRTKVHSDIRYNVGLCALQSDIGRFDIRLSPISLITDIGLSAHLCYRCLKREVSGYRLQYSKLEENTNLNIYMR